MRDKRRTQGSGPLPLEARRILWQRLWDRLLAPPPEHAAGTEPALDWVPPEVDARGNREES